MNAPVALFTYNRLSHTKATVEALLTNKPAAATELYIFSDGPANVEQRIVVDEVRNYLRTIKGFSKIHIIERPLNFGLGNNIIDGVTGVVEIAGKIIVLEDDLITAPYFLEYMNDGLDTYAFNDKVISIHGYTYPVTDPLPETFFLRGADCWGWGTWKRGWDKFQHKGTYLLEQLEALQLTYKFDFDGSYPFTQMLRDQIMGKNSSWAVRWYASAFLEDKYTLYPGQSLVMHAGGDGSGTNTGYDELLNVKLSDRPIKVNEKNVEQDAAAFSAFAKVLKKQHDPPFLYRLKRKMRQLLK